MGWNYSYFHDEVVRNYLIFINFPIIQFNLILNFSISPRNVMLIGMVSQILVGSVTGLLTSLEIHMLFRTFAAICCGLMYTSGGVIC